MLGQAVLKWPAPPAPSADAAAAKELRQKQLMAELAALDSD
jgi:hypothetical protein